MSVKVSENSNVVPTPKPTIVRTMTIVLHVGKTDKTVDADGNETVVWTSTPYAEIIMQPADPLLDKTGAQMTTPDYGMGASSLSYTKEDYTLSSTFHLTICPTCKKKECICPKEEDRLSRDCRFWKQEITEPLPSIQLEDKGICQHPLVKSGKFPKCLVSLNNEECYSYTCNCPAWEEKKPKGD